MRTLEEWDLYCFGYPTGLSPDVTGVALVAEKREVWLDETNIEPTAEWLKEIFSNIEASDNFLFVISPDSVVSMP